MEPPVEFTYKGVTYKRNPDSKKWAGRVYYNAPRKSGRGFLHRDIYADIHGPIPKGMNIHHQDHNPFNNEPPNLVMMTASEHQRHHREHEGKFSEERLKIHRETTLVAAAEWHRSEEGRAWHRQHGKAMWENPKMGTFTCPECGVQHQGYFPTRGDVKNRYCSGKCRQRGDKRLGKYEKYMEEVVCPMCSSIFKRMRGRVTPKTCSSTCGAKMRWQR